MSASVSFRSMSEKPESNPWDAYPGMIIKSTLAELSRLFDWRSDLLKHSLRDISKDCNWPERRTILLERICRRARGSDVTDKSPAPGGRLCYLSRVNCKERCTLPNRTAH